MKTILVVDDEIDIAELLQSFLEAKGYRVLVAFDGCGALHEVMENKPDLIITDMMMPRMDGLELIANIRATPTISDIPIITMSANQRPQELPFFRKPFKVSDMLVQIRCILECQKESVPGL